jgi:hypothetical protein
VADTPSQRPDPDSDSEPETLLYEERRSALRWPLVTAGALGALLVVGGIVLALLTQEPLFVLVSVVGFSLWLVTKGGQYFLHRHTGIRITTKRITVGAVDLAADGEQDPSRPQRAVVLLGTCAYSCDLEDLLSLTIVTDPGAIRAMRKDRGNLGSPAGAFGVTSSITRKLGMVVPPYAKAVLVIHMYLGAGHFPRIANGKKVTHLQSPTWAVPTRRPEELRRALASFPATARFDLAAAPAAPRAR